jgi:phosphatidylglycerophosphate synthase
MTAQEHVDKEQYGKQAPSPLKGQQMPKPTIGGSIYSEEEARVLGPWQKIRQVLFFPLALALSRLGIGPDMLSFSSVALSIGFCLLAPFHFTVAFWLLVASFLLDGLDGVIARLTKSNVARGSFTDACCDQAVLAFSVAGMAWVGAIHPVLAVLFVYVYTTLVIFLVLHHLLRISSRWIVRPGRTLFYACIGLNFFFHINLLNDLLLVYLLAFPILAMSFWRLRKAL